MSSYFSNQNKIDNRYLFFTAEVSASVFICPASLLSVRLSNGKIFLLSFAGLNFWTYICSR
nr:MAG TPA: hypothetical protein [Bacteriophage sp.]